MLSSSRQRWSFAYYGMLISLLLLCLLSRPATARSIRLFEDDTASYDSSADREQQLVRRVAPSSTVFCLYYPSICKKAKESVNEAIA
ncbi:hypothetical protein M3Y97_00526100 [Aphelenchoides bicaudatus]|nr:hypothetical protein M3Y97_00526100 [Aphelenchoides bicaudatus]